MSPRIRGDRGHSPLRERELGERVATLEVKVEQIMEDGLRREEKQADAHALLLEKLDSLEGKFDVAQNELSRYKGFAGGVLLMISAMATAIGFLFKSWLKPLWDALVRLKTGGGV